MAGRRLERGVADDVADDDVAGAAASIEGPGVGEADVARTRVDRAVPQRACRLDVARAEVGAHGRAGRKADHDVDGRGVEDAGHEARLGSGHAQLVAEQLDAGGLGDLDMCAIVRVGRADIDHGVGAVAGHNLGASAKCASTETAMGVGVGKVCMVVLSFTAPSR